MIVKQTVSPNLNPVAYDDGKLLLSWRGECLATLRAAFGAPLCGATAAIGWSNTKGRHEDRNFPVGVYFPLWFSGAGGAGHACFAFVNNNGSINIWTSPWEEAKPYFDNYSSIERLEQGYHITFIGWSECIGSFRVIELLPDPVPAVEIVPAPVSSNTTYTKLDTPLDLVTNKQPTNWWGLGFTNDAHATAAAQLAQGTPFRAFGRAQRTDGDRPAYFMTQEDFGNADTTGVPVNNNGINTVDLSPAELPAPAPPEEPVLPPKLASASPPMSSVIPVTPPLPAWKKASKNVASYTALENYRADDLDTGVLGSELYAGQTVHAVVRRTKNSIEYVFTQKNEDRGTFNGVPLNILQLIKPIDIALDDDKVLDDLDMGEVGYKVKSDVEKLLEPLKSASFRAKLVDLVARFVFRAKKQKI